MMIKVGAEIVPSRVPPTLFGPFRSKRLPTFFTKADGDPPKAKAPKPESPKPQETPDQPTEQVQTPPAPPAPTPPPPEEPPEPPVFLEQIPADITPEQEEAANRYRQENEDFLARVTRKPEPPELTKMDMSFYQSIKENPNDNAPRLIYADWLEERGQPDRAEFIRLQIEMSDMRWNFSGQYQDRYNKAKERTDELLRVHREEWTWPWSQDDGTSEFQFRRGMMHLMDNSLSFINTLVQYGTERALANVDSVKLYGSASNVTRALTTVENTHTFNPEGGQWLAHITSLSLQDTPQLNQFGQIVMNTIRRRAANTLVELRLEHTSIGSDLSGTSIEALVREGGMKKLEVLDLSYNNLSDQSVQNLIYFGYILNKIRRLDLRGNNIERRRREQLIAAYDVDTVHFE